MSGSDSAGITDTGSTVGIGIADSTDEAKHVLRARAQPIEASAALAEVSSR
jgi:hypothetical protein